MWAEGRTSSDRLLAKELLLNSTAHFAFHFAAPDELEERKENQKLASLKSSWIIIGVNRRAITYLTVAWFGSKKKDKKNQVRVIKP